LRRDLILLGQIPRRRLLDAPQPSGHASGVDYVLAGSHFGAAMLVKRLERSADPRVRGATHYLSGGHLRSIWPHVVEDLAALDPKGLQAATVAAGWTFAIFERAGAAIAAPEGLDGTGRTAALRA
jgi:heme oxygenase